MNETINIPEVGDVVRPLSPELNDFVDRNDLTVEWVGVNLNQVIVAGLFRRHRTVDGRYELAPRYGILVDYGWGRGWIINPSVVEDR